MGLWSVVRWMRAASFAGTCAALAAAGHVLGGGCVGRLSLLAGFLVVFALALVLTRREHTIATILPAVAVCQVVLHVLLSQTSPGHAMTPAAAAGTAYEGAAMQPHPGSSWLGMLLMHTLAVLVTSWWLECGEIRLCALVRRVTCWALRSFARLRPVPVYGPARVVPVRRHVRAPFRALVLRYAMVRRGPPMSLVALG